MFVTNIELQRFCVFYSLTPPLSPMSELYNFSILSDLFYIYAFRALFHIILLYANLLIFSYTRQMYEKFDC